MTPGTRRQLKLAVDVARRAHAAVLIADYGTDSCDYCSAWIDAQPRKRFCTDRCRKKWSWNTMNRAAA